MLLSRIPPLWSSRSQWLKLAAGCFPFPMSTSLRSHFLLYRDHHLHSPSSKDKYLYWLFQTLLLPPPQLIPVLSVKTSLQNMLCCIQSSSPTLSRPKSTSQHATAYWWQKSASRIQLSKCVFSNKLLRQKVINHRVQFLCICVWVITFCHGSGC